MSSINQRLFLVNLVIVIGVLVAWRALFDIDALRALDSGASLAAAVHGIETRLAASFGVILAVVILIQIYLHRTIASPLRKLLAEIDRLAVDGSAQMLPVQGSDEIAGLAARFNELQEQISRRIRELEQFAENISHEIRTPLTSILSAAEILSDDAHLEPRSRAEFLTMIKTEAERLRNLSTSILSYARGSGGRASIQRRDQNLSQLLRELAATFPADRLHFTDRQREGSTIAFVDPLLLTQALRIILDNAQRYSPATSPIELRLSVLDEDGSSPQALIVISNDGPSIPSAYLDKIFERFFSLAVNEQSKGNGIGLALCRDLVEAQGGRVDAMNLAPRGVAFSVTLPLL